MKDTYYSPFSKAIQFRGCDYHRLHRRLRWALALLALAAAGCLWAGMGVGK